MSTDVETRRERKIGQKRIKTLSKKEKIDCLKFRNTENKPLTLYRLQ